MKIMIFFLLVSIIINSIQSQTWTGTYTPDSLCNTASCCCLSDKAVITSSSANTYTVLSGASGACGGATTFTGILYTNGYTGWMVVGVDNDTVTLSSDSANITVTNSRHPACSGNGVKNGSTIQHPNIVSYIIGYVLMGMMTKNSIV
ncbi:unnamed protein product [Adineta ricciae]|uniref:Uncharacterized protein n=1 Tax=Adineta ricciae TaxID=249248 RepID=A0A816F8M2_ADIRI|nr:unnamed protein product [Adineta ricciae]